MQRIEDIIAVIESLPELEYKRLHAWFIAKDEEQWDRQIEADARAGRLDQFAHSVEEARRAGELREL
jgi:hypothetical protein